MDRGAWQAACQWVPKSQTPLKRVSMQAGVHSKGNWDDAVCTVGGLGCLVLLMPRQYCQTCPASPQPLSPHQTCPHTGAVMEPVTDAAAVTGAPQPDPLLPLRWSQEHWLLQAQRYFQGQGPSLPHDRPPGTLPLNDHFKQPLKKVFPSSCLPQEQLRSLPLFAVLFLRCLSETPVEGGCLRGSEGASSRALDCPLFGLGLESSQKSILILG